MASPHVMSLSAISRKRCRSRRQRGVATLVVVLVLFFVVSMVAAYTNRNLIFEQRTSSNQYRSTQALEAAEAGLEWITAVLNSGRVDDACAPSSSTSDKPLRERLLSIDRTGRITPAVGPSGEQLSAACVYTGNAWSCSCPTSGTASVTPPTGAGSFPAFRVRFQRIIGDSSSATVPRQPGVVKVQVVGCTRADASSGDQCLQFNAGQGAAGEGRALVSAMLGLTGNLSSPPQAALVARQRVLLDSGDGISAFNGQVGGTGITIHSGGSISGTKELGSQPGSPGGEASVRTCDTTLDLPPIPAAASASASSALSTADRMFTALFNLRPEVFMRQAVLVECNGTCSAQQVVSKAQLNPWRPLWLTGGLSVDRDIGGPAAPGWPAVPPWPSVPPVLMVVNGDVQFTNNDAKIYGFVYVQTRLQDPPVTDNVNICGRTVERTTATWITSGGGQVRGATVADQRIGGSGTTKFVYDPDVLAELRWITGSFVRVPGSWKDFE